MTVKRCTVLYVEDNDYIRQSFVELLDADDRQILGAGGAAEARQALRDNDVGLLITDVNLPDGSGLEVAREALRQNPRLPVIVCSGDDMRGIAESLGPTAHAMRKPVDLDELEGRVAQLVRSA